MTKFVLDMDIQGCVDCKLKYWDKWMCVRCIVTREELTERPSSVTYRHESCPLKKKEEVEYDSRQVAW